MEITVELLQQKGFEEKDKIDTYTYYAMGDLIIRRRWLGFGTFFFDYYDPYSLLFKSKEIKTEEQLDMLINLFRED